MFGLSVAELVAMVLFAHQGVTHALLYRASRRPELLQHALWCLWATLLPATQLVIMFRVSHDVTFVALHAMSIVVPVMMRSYLASIASYLGIENRILNALIRWQLIMVLPPMASLISYALGGDPFFLREPTGASASPLLAMVSELVPRNEVHPAYLAAAVSLAAADLGVLLFCAWRAPRRDSWVLFGIVVTCAAVAFEVTAFWSGSRFAVPTIFAANLLQVLRVTFVSTKRAGEESALLERELAQQRQVVASQLEALDASARLSTLGELAFEIGHEMRNPVASATLFIEAARRRAEAGGPIEEPLWKASAALAQLGALVAGISRYGRHDVDDARTPVPLRTAIEDAAALCAHRLRAAEAELEVRVPARLRVLASTTELIQLFVNLLANACDALEQADAAWIRVEAECSERRIVLRVCDAGATPAPALADSMFAAPFTTKRAGRGSGLGLQICRRIVESLGGSIVLDRQSTTTIIVVELPRANEGDDADVRLRTP
jgi:signal transduction histidine kinase